MKNKTAKIIIIALCVVLVLALISGGVYLFMKNRNRISDDEAKSIMQQLVPKAETINDIVWGKGLAVAEGETAAMDTVTSAQYRRVAADSPYTNVEQLKSAIAEVYSDDFINSAVNYAAFDGADGATDDALDMYPRYKDNNEGWLCIDITNPGFDITTQIDPSGAAVKSCNFDKVTLEVQATVQGENKTLEITIKNQDGEWRLDTPTY